VSPLERFAANLKEVRAERGWSQEDLSRATGLHTTAISKMAGIVRLASRRS
jgi:transcriptional regulator with XRE-family HTH domain